MSASVGDAFRGARGDHRIQQLCGEDEHCRTTAESHRDDGDFTFGVADQSDELAVLRIVGNAAEVPSFGGGVREDGVCVAVDANGSKSGLVGKGVGTRPTGEGVAACGEDAHSPGDGGHPVEGCEHHIVARVRDAELVECALKSHDGLGEGG